MRVIQAIVNEALAALEWEFTALYAPIGRPSIPPEKLLRAMLLQAFYSIRSERQLTERQGPTRQTTGSTLGNATGCSKGSQMTGSGAMYLDWCLYLACSRRPSQPVYRHHDNLGAHPHQRTTVVALGRC